MSIYYNNMQPLNFVKWPLYKDKELASKKISGILNMVQHFLILDEQKMCKKWQEFYFKSWKKR